MSDRELLELAAKAAGIVGAWHERGQCIHVTNCAGMSDTWWRPLTDDGDALRLAVKLYIDIRFHWDGCEDQYNEVEAYTHGAGKDATEEIGFYERDGQIDEDAATRRAIVRAAAEIGRAMP